MLAIQSGIAKCHCLYTQGTVAFETPGVFFYSPGTTQNFERRVLLLTCQLFLH